DRVRELRQARHEPVEDRNFTALELLIGVLPDLLLDFVKPLEVAFLELTDSFKSQRQRVQVLRDSLNAGTSKTDNVGNKIVPAHLLCGLDEIFDRLPQVVNRRSNIVNRAADFRTERFDQLPDNTSEIFGDLASQRRDRAEQVGNLRSAVSDLPQTVGEPLEEVLQSLLELGAFECFEHFLERVADHVADNPHQILQQSRTVPHEVLHGPQGSLEPVGQLRSTLEQVVQNLLALRRLERFVEALHTVRHLTETGEPGTFRGGTKDVNCLTRLTDQLAELLQLLNTGIDYPVQFARLLRLVQPVRETRRDLVRPLRQTGQVLGAGLAEDRHGLHHVADTFGRDVDRLIQVAEHLVECRHVEMDCESVSEGGRPVTQGRRSLLDAFREVRERFVPRLHQRDLRLLPEVAGHVILQLAEVPADLRELFIEIPQHGNHRANTDSETAKDPRKRQGSTGKANELIRQVSHRTNKRGHTTNGGDCQGADHPQRGHMLV